MTNEEKTQKLLGLIEALRDPSFAKSPNRLNNWIHVLYDIYSDGYRHSYADLFYELQNVFSSDPDVSECLGENLNVLQNELQNIVQQESREGEHPGVVEGFKKFADHIRLEIGRYNFIRSQFAQYQQGIDADPSGLQGGGQNCAEVQGKLNKLQEDLNKIRPIAMQAQKELDNLDTKLESNKISSLTTLTIFSAVVLAFSGGITFEAGMLQGMASASSYRLVFSTALSGFILFNTLFVLLYLVAKLTGKRISSRCKYMNNDKTTQEDCQACGDGYCSKAFSSVSVPCRMFHKYGYVFAINIILIYILYADYFLWLFRKSEAKWILLSCLAIPILILITIWCVREILYRERKRRVIFAARIKLVESLLGKDVPVNIVSRAIANILTQAFASNSLSIEDRFQNEVCKQLKSKGRHITFAKYLQQTDLFVEKNMLNAYDIHREIDREQHRRNKLLWKQYKGEFRQFLQK